MMVELSRATPNKMRQNLARAIGYNMLAIPIAAGLFADRGFVLRPEIGALAMSGSPSSSQSMPFCYVVPVCLTCTDRNDVRGFRMNMASVRLRSLLIQLLAWVIFPMLLVLLAVTYSGVAFHERAMRTLVGERDERAVRAAAEALADRFVQRRLTLQALTDRIADGISFTRILEDEPDLRQVFDGGLIAVDEQTEVIGSWQPGIPWASSLRSSAKPWVLDHDRSTPMVVVRAQSANGKIMLFGGISLTSLNVPATMGVMRNSPQTRLYLIADDGHILEDSAGLAVGANASSWAGLENLFTGQDGRIADQSPQSTESDTVTVWSHVEGLDWTLVVQEPWAEVINPGLQLSLLAPLAAIPAVLIALGVMIFGLVSVVLPLRRLGRATTHLSWGNYEALHQPVGGVQEIRDLQTTLSHMAQRLQQAQAGMHSYIGAMIQGQEDERKRLARELHDDTLQSLIALDQQRQMAQRALERDPNKAEKYLDQIHTTLEDTIKNLRGLIRDMRPTYIEDLGLVPALEMLCTQNPTTTSEQIYFKAAGTPRRLRADQELGLYRIAQEAISNALRHAKATRIQVELRFDQDVALEIRDDGQGFVVPERPGSLAQSGHYGLMGMVERSEQMGAQLQIDSRPDKGTAVSVHLVGE